MSSHESVESKVVQIQCDDVINKPQAEENATLISGTNLEVCESGESLNMPEIIPVENEESHSARDADDLQTLHSQAFNHGDDVSLEQLSPSSSDLKLYNSEPDEDNLKYERDYADNIKDSTNGDLDRESSTSPSEIEEGSSNGNEMEELRKLCIHLQSVLDQQLKERERMQKKNEDLSEQMKLLKETNSQLNNSCKETLECTNKSQPAEIASLKKELEAAKMILETQGSKFNKEMSCLTSSYTTKLDHFTRSFEECKKEKESMVIRYAQAESRNIELQESWRRADHKMKECMKDKESALSKCHVIKTENSRLLKLLETKDNELASLKRDCDGLRETANSREFQIKSYQMKIKKEQDVSKEAKEKMQEMVMQVASERIDCECFLNELKALIQANQMLQLTGSLPTLTQITNRIELVINKKKEETQSKELWMDIYDNLLSLVTLTNNLMADNVSFKEKVKRVTENLSSNEATLNDLHGRMEEFEEEKKELQLRMEDARSKCHTMQLEMDGLKESKEMTTEVMQNNEELRAEMELQTKRYSECLEYTNKLSEIYASLQTKNIRLNSEIEFKNEENEKLISKCKSLEDENKQLIEQRLVGMKDYEDKVASLERQMEQRTTEFDMLKIQFNDVEDELKSLRRQSGARIKDLTRQIHKLNRNLRHTTTTPEYDSSGSSNFSENGLVFTTPIHSSTNPPRNSVVHHGAPTAAKKITFEDERGLGPLRPQESRARDELLSNRILPRNKVLHDRKCQVDNSEVMCDDVQKSGTAEVGYLTPPSVRVVEVNKQMLVDKIVSLQKTLAKKNERMDFLQELNLRLSQDVASKARIIQNYVLKEETGVMSTNQSDRLKLQMSRRGGIMASLFSSQPQDEAMTVDLALEISHKLQSVLEDTLLKNIALKESMELLGQQVAKLTRDNKNSNNSHLVS